MIFYKLRASALDKNFHSIYNESDKNDSVAARQTEGVPGACMSPAGKEKAGGCSAGAEPVLSNREIEQWTRFSKAA
jgi:hypothetical protein